MDKNHSIKTVSKISGLPAIVIRTWENRYGAITPSRTESNHRLYSDEDIDKLVALSKLTKRGYKISNIAQLSLQELNNILIKDEFNSKPTKTDFGDGQFKNILNKYFTAIRAFDTKEFEKLLADSSINFSLPILIDNIVVPLIEEIGDSWKNGEYRISHEHFTSFILRKFFSNISSGYNIQSNAPGLIVTTPHGQYHEIGALIGGALAASDGWRITYLDPSLPSEEIAFVMKHTNSKVVLLSIVYPNDDLQLITELRKLRELSGKKSHIIVNGRSTNGYINVLSEINADVVSNSEQLRQTLFEKRKLIKLENEGA